MPASENIRLLVQRFEANRESYRSGKYNETQLRREFLDPFFEALGWDVFNKQGYAETYKDIIHEDSLEIEGENKAPDYSFRIGGVRKFFVEAKKPAVNIESNIHPAFQLRRYAWSAKFPISILTDFEEFAIYDCRTKPDKKDKASLGRISLYSFKDYVEKWDEIAAVFSRDAVLKGSFDQYAENLKGKKGTTEVDDAFLAEIERWRDLLAKNIALRNPSLNVRELNYAVQMTIDRIIFLRICEDRGVERDEQLKEIATNPLPASPKSAKKVLENQETLNADLGEVPDRAEGVGSVYAALCALFKKADARYNSGLFHFKEEKEQSGAADSLTLSLNVDDKVLQDILKNLYYPESPYVFREIPSDILGQVYERFLGKVIRLTAGHQAKVEEKPEVRKAGGVYYTPTYIVEYIVQNTVGKLLEDKTPKDAAKLKILDPACGSGTFPLGAYQYLLDWHLKWYLEHEPEKWLTGKSPAIYQSKDGYRLTTAKKKEILLNNIFGVDIDAQAVEVTKLSLLLKVLEGESSETIGSQLALFQERVLPDLGRNIKCGNSLIGPDYYEGHQLTMEFADEEERYRVNAFDWRGEFADVFIHGGFDAVIGNPPYLKIEHISEEDRKYFSRRYKTFIKRYDTYGLFVEIPISILKSTGLFGMIVPSTMLNNMSFKDLRKLLIDNVSIKSIINLGGKVFERVNNDTLILIYENKRIDNIETQVFDVLTYGKRLNTAVLTGEKDLKTTALAPDYLFELRVFKDIDALIAKMRKDTIKLGDVYACFQGLVTGGNEAYIVNSAAIQKEKLESEICKPAAFGDEVSRYNVPSPKSFVIYLTREMKMGQYPNIKSHLDPYKAKLETKREVKLGRQPWYSLHWPRVQENFERKPKILVQAIRNLSLKRRIVATIDNEGLYADHTLNILYAKHEKYHINFALAILNSSLVNFIFSKKYIDINIKGIYLTDIPLPDINFSDPTEKAMHDKMVSLVERMLELHKQSPRTPQESEMVKREIESTDVRIDRLVYELYGLTEDEIRIVES